MTDFTATRALFDLPDGIIYLDGNSLGPTVHGTSAALARVVEREWGSDLIRAWNTAGWMDLPRMLGGRIAPLIGAKPDTVMLGDTLSLKVYQALAAALDIVPDRRVVLSDTGNFPNDLYMASGLLRLKGADYHLRVVDPDAVADALTDDVAVLMLTEVDYRTGRKHDMAVLTRRAQARGIATVWDLAHSAGALPVDVSGCDVDFAVGCTYKYLNGGPGAPAFIYAAPRHQEGLQPALSGWLGHEAPFDFSPVYRPGAGVDRLRVGTPGILAMRSLEHALSVWDVVSLGDVRTRSIALMEQFIKAVEESCPDLSLASPRDPAQRGSQVSFRHPQGYAIMQALISAGVIGDFRAPDIIRFGFTPLYLDSSDVAEAARRLATIMSGQLWDREAYKTRAAVT